MSRTTRKPKTTEPTREEIQASIRAFGETMWKPAPAPKTMPALNPVVFEMDAETAARWAIVSNAGR